MLARGDRQQTDSRAAREIHIELWMCPAGGVALAGEAILFNARTTDRQTDRQTDIFNQSMQGRLQ